MGELRELWLELWSARRRLLPVVLGLCFGTLGLSVLLAFGDAFDVAMHSALARSGESMLRWMSGGTTRPFAGQPAGRRVWMTPRALAALAAAPGVVATSLEAQRTLRIAGVDGHTANVTVCAVGPQWDEVRGRRVAAGGRFLSPVDEQQRRRVVVLGSTVAARLLPGRDPIGAEVRILDAPFTVVGVMPRESMLMNYGGDDDLKAWLPFATAKPLLGLRIVDYALARVADAGAPAAAEQVQRRALAGQYRFDAGDRDAVRVQNHAENAAIIRGIVVSTRVFLFVVGALSLLVAALGVANMMFVLVEERVPEIGLRMALGATPRQVRRRQLLETACVVAIGGGGGLLLASALLLVIDQLPMPPDAKAYLGHPLLSVATALLIAGILGVCASIAGWHPAARAASVQPIEVLRDE